MLYIVPTNINRLSGSIKIVMSSFNPVVNQGRVKPVRKEEIELICVHHVSSVKCEIEILNGHIYTDVSLICYSPALSCSLVAMTPSSWCPH